MNIKFEFLGLNCLAVGSIKDGHFVPDEINATGQLDESLLSGEMLDKLCGAMDKAAGE